MKALHIYIDETAIEVFTDYDVSNIAFTFDELAKSHYEDKDVYTVQVIALTLFLEYDKVVIYEGEKYCEIYKGKVLTTGREIRENHNIFSLYASGALKDDFVRQ